MRTARWRPAAWLWLPGLALLLASGCATTPEAATSVERGSLRVENRNTEDMSLFLVREGAQVYLGIVPGLERRRFRLTEAQCGCGNIQVLVKPHHAEDRYLSPDVVVEDGTTLRLRIEQRLQLSSLMLL